MGRFFLLSLLVMQMATAFSQSDYKFKSVPSFEDNFDTFNTKTWSHIITNIGSEFEYYTNRTENSYVRRGVLYLRPTLTVARFNNSEDFLYHGTLDLTKEGCNVNYNGKMCRVEANDSTDIISPIQSARIHTKNSFSFKYGKLEVRAKMPSGDWLFPAIWLSPSSSKYGPNPNNGEVDLAEVFCNEKFFCDKDDRKSGTYSMGTTLHWGKNANGTTTDMFKLKIFQPYTSAEDGRTYWKTYFNRSLSANFHVYGLEWTPVGFRFLVDGKEVGWMRPPVGGFQQLYREVYNETLWANADNVRMAPFDEPFHIILNIAVGGNGIPDYCRNMNGPKPWKYGDRFPKREFWEARANWLPTWDNCKTEKPAMKVDWVRVYELDNESYSNMMH